MTETIVLMGELELIYLERRRIKVSLMQTKFIDFYF